MKKVIALHTAEAVGKKYDIGVADTHNYFADGLLVHNCTLPKDSNIDKFDWKRGVFSQIKADGSFTNLYSGVGDNSKIETRNGTLYPSVPAFDQLRIDLAAIHAYYNGTRHDDPGIVLHGEALVKDAEGNLLPREVGNGMLNSLTKGGEMPAGHSIVVQVWDVVDEGHFNSRTSPPVTYEERFEFLEDIIKDVMPKSIQLIESKLVYSREEAKEHYKQVRAQGLEGTVLKAPTAFWIDGDNKDQVKFKAEAKVELRILDFKPGEGKYVGTLGSLLCGSDDEKLEVGVSGMTDAWRKEFWDNQEKYKGAVVTVLANGVMMPTEEGQKAALFLPRLVEIRADRTDTDTLERMIAIFQAA